MRNLVVTPVSSIRQYLSNPKQATDRDLYQAETEYARGLDYFRLRIKAIGFIGETHILDAGCGYGQWSIALSEKNGQISSIDINPGGLEIGREVSKALKRKNIAFSRGDLHRLPYGDASFDGVFCYGVLMLTREDIALSELIRVLKPGGKLYVCSDGPAWPLYRMIHFGWKQREIRTVFSGLSITFRTIWVIICRRFSHSRTFLRKRDIRNLFHINGIRMDYYGVDGTFGNRERQFQAPFGKTLLSLPVDFEVLGIKNE